MLSKCANPGCSNMFRYLRQGKLFLIEVAARSCIRRTIADSHSGTSRAIDYVWLCASCCREMTVCIEQDGMNRVVCKPDGRGQYFDLVKEQTHLAEQELSSFLSAVTKLHGPEQAGLSAQDWLDEFESFDGASLSAKESWRAVTIAASARLAARLSASESKTNPHRD